MRYRDPVTGQITEPATGTMPTNGTAWDGGPAKSPTYSGSYVPSGGAYEPSSSASASSKSTHWTGGVAVGPSTYDSGSATGSVGAPSVSYTGVVGASRFQARTGGRASTRPSRFLAILIVLGLIAIAYGRFQSARLRDEGYARNRAYEAAHPPSAAERKRDHDLWVQGQAYRKHLKKTMPGVILSPNPPEPPK